ncbi:VOC family protein [Paenibacillus sacheonensis]|uniref:VOC family protein n=1 Tax=Paenibacillus sacheonensis TaxID=742054 RepID=A0A7X4YVZ8_9BACL|nr:VOC family protein [Paenibacillus sacheonensis]MBM7566639.1 PhnB protein [Paenibacillus sacheonensis]NBC73555.1 VOC family protein [Paenibacillus sacheonensis]
MAQLIPYIYSDDAREQAAFYAGALGGEIVSVQTFGDMPGSSPDDKERVMHLILQAAGLTFYMADAGPVERGSGMDLTLEYESAEEAGEAFAKLAAGGQVLMPFAKMFWGSMFGRLVDPFGVRWQVATRLDSHT